MPRFVLLLHETPSGYPRPTHYDLMLEHGETLWTWALDELPEANKRVAAERLRDHRPDYLDFEGAINGNRGSVRRIDQGDYELIRASEESLAALLHGSMLRGPLEVTTGAAPQRCWVSFSAE